MIRLQGKGVSTGVATGPLYFYRRGGGDIVRHEIADVAAELERFEAARLSAIDQLKALYDKALAEVGEESAQLFEAHQLMLDDLDYIESIQGMINDKVNAEAAVSDTAGIFADMFANMDDAYMQARAADVRDISTRVIGILSGVAAGGINSDVPVILASDDLAPSETVQLDKSKILGFVTQGGSGNSHTAILARTMGIPAICSVGEALTSDYEGKDVLIDGQTGEVVFDADEATSDRLLRKQAKERALKELLEKLKGQPNVTLDGKNVMVYCNIGSPEDVDSVLRNDGGGIGLFRSEFLYLQNDDYPSEEQQFQAYKAVAERMGGKRVIIRTLDIGADKQVDYFNLGNEDNPALGYRAIRICLKQPDIFKTQVRALLRAAVFGNLSVMYPMIISVDEVKKVYEIVEEVRQELEAKGIPYKMPEQGIMIETPAAVMVSDELAQIVDFFSIGTNDLTQYTLAIDRQNAKLDDFYNPHHPAVLRMIKMVTDNAHKHGKWAGICGELGADPELTEEFMRMGLDELSVAPSMILKLRKAVREMDLSRDA